MKLLTSSRMRLPALYFITDREEISKLPIGIPYIVGDEDMEEYIVRLLEYEILYESAVRSGYPFNFKQILRDEGYSVSSMSHGGSAYIDYTTEGIDKRYSIDEKSTTGSTDKNNVFKRFVKDVSAYVDITKLKDLNVFPKWLSVIEEAITVNINSFASFNPNMYNKKLDGMFGASSLSSPPRNLIIIDISGSIPRAVSSTCLTLARNLSETFYADIMITGSKTTLYEYENISDLDVNTIYSENGMDNDQVYFRTLLTEKEKKYNTVVVFGDNDHPGRAWSNSYNRDSTKISDEDGIKECKWEIKKMVSLHTSNRKSRSIKQTAGYGRWFEVDDVDHVDDWVKYL